MTTNNIKNDIPPKLSCFLKYTVNSIFIIITAFLTFFITYKVNDLLNPKGKPKIIPEINHIILRQNIDTDICNGELSINILNTEQDETNISIKNLNVYIPYLGINPLIINSNLNIKLDSYTNKNILFNFEFLPNRKSQTDSLFTMKIEIELKLFYAPNELAAKLSYNNKINPSISFVHIWDKIDIDKYYQELHNLSKYNKLPKTWKKIEVEYGLRKYDCYFRPPTYEFDIFKTGETLSIKEKLGNIKDLEIGSFQNIERFDFIPNPDIKNHFINLDKRIGYLNIIIYKDNYIITKDVEFEIHSNYRNLIWINKDESF